MVPRAGSKGEGPGQGPSVWQLGMNVGPLHHSLSHSIQLGVNVDNNAGMYSSNGVLLCSTLI